VLGSAAGQEDFVCSYLFVDCSRLDEPVGEAAISAVDTQPGGRRRNVCSSFDLIAIRRHAPHLQAVISANNSHSPRRATRRVALCFVNFISDTPPQINQLSCHFRHQRSFPAEGEEMKYIVLLFLFQILRLRSIKPSCHLLHGLSFAAVVHRAEEYIVVSFHSDLAAQINQANLPLPPSILVRGGGTKRRGANCLPGFSFVHCNL
jgi:hypothetical protein